jgi:LCP family protein required for cell wall assembly
VRRDWQPRAFVQRFFVALVVTTVLMGSAVGGAYWYGNERIDDAEHLDLDLPDGGNFLLIGSDTRAFVADGIDEQHFGDPSEQTGQRSDTIMVAHIDPKTKTGLLVSFPRDLWVDIPGLGHAKLNAAFNEGPERVIATLQQNFGFDVNHYVEVNFDGFRDIVDAIGSVPIYFPTPVRDKYTGLLVEQAGCRNLSGEEALAYVRSRYYQYQDADGEWHDDPASDLGRIRRQQYFIRSLAQEAIHAGARNPLKLPGIMDKAVDHLVLGDVGTSDLLKLANRFRTEDPSSLEMLTVPTHPDNIDGQSVLVLNEAEALPIFERLRSDTATTTTAAPNVPPAEVSVEVLNGSGVQGQAKTVLGGLGDLGFDVVEPPANADRNDYEHTEVRYGPGAEAKAQTVLASLGGAGQLVKLDEAPEGADILVIVGRDFDHVASATTAPAATAAPTADTGESTATAAPGTTTTTGPAANPGGTGPMPSAGC